MKNYVQNDIIKEFYSEAVKGIIVDESILSDFNKWKCYCLNLPKKEQITYTISLFDWQVKNGGFHQYFFNSYGMFCFSTIQNLIEVKCLRHADLLKKAIEIIYNESEPAESFMENIFHRNVDAISSFDENVLQRFELLDTEYYRIEESCELYDKLKNYLLE